MFCSMCAHTHTHTLVLLVNHFVIRITLCRCCSVNSRGCVCLGQEADFDSFPNMQPQHKQPDAAHVDYRPVRWHLPQGSRVFTFPALSRESRRMHICICAHTSHRHTHTSHSHLLHSPICAADVQDDEVQAVSDLHPEMVCMRYCTFCLLLRGRFLFKLHIFETALAKKERRRQ